MKTENWISKLAIQTGSYLLSHSLPLTLKPDPPHHGRSYRSLSLRSPTPALRWSSPSLNQLSQPRNLSLILRSPWRQRWLQHQSHLDHQQPRRHCFLQVLTYENMPSFHILHLLCTNRTDSSSHI